MIMCSFSASDLICIFWFHRLLLTHFSRYIENFRIQMNIYLISSHIHKKKYKNSGISIESSLWHDLAVVSKYIFWWGHGGKTVNFYPQSNCLSGAHTASDKMTGLLDYQNGKDSLFISESLRFIPFKWWCTFLIWAVISKKTNLLHV